MKKILLKVSYQDNNGKYWQDSYIKNKILNLDDDINNVVAKAILENDGVVLLYKNKPQAYIYIDDKNGNSKAVGYIYRGSNEIYNDNKRKYEKALFDVWVDIKIVEDYPITIIE